MHGTAMMRRLYWPLATGYCLLVLSGCAHAHAKAAPDQPALAMPEPPPHDVEPVDAEVPAPMPLPGEPEHRTPPRTRAPQRAEPAKPEPKPEAPKTDAPAEAPKWMALENFGRLENGQMRALDVATIPVLFVKAGENLYAYRNFCPACQSSLDLAVLDAKVLSCRSGHRFDVQRAGLSPDNPELHLEPFPLLSANGAVKISVR